ncbi:PAS domain S-box protein [candidate division WOR-3 bacterium]|nr:PAS domain S-box protein [candidate division WOR-3 bacterium]
MDQKTNAELRQRITALEAEIVRLKAEFFKPSALNTVSVPDALKPIFDKAQGSVKQYFEKVVADPAKGTIDISDERYLLIRASTFAINFLDTIHKVYADREPEEAEAIGHSLLFDIAHTIGMNDARALHKRMGLVEPIEKLSAGPVHFAYTGWAFVNIHPDSNPVPNNDFVITYDHPYSFEAHSWLAAGRRSKHPVCIMNAGYSSGWCEESFGIPLTSVEITCRAKGDDTCTFIMAPPHRIVERIQEFYKIDLEGPRCPIITIPTYFKRKQTEEALGSLIQFQKQMLDTAAIWIDTLDPDGNVTSWNRAAERISGYSKEEVLNNSKIWEWLYPDEEYRRRITTEAAEIIRQGKRVENFETTIQCKDGEQRIIAWYSNNLKDSEDKIIGSIALGADVTEQKHNEQQLKASEQKHRRLVENLGRDCFLYRHDRHRHYTFVSPSIKDVLGYTPEEYGKQVDTILTNSPGNERIYEYTTKTLRGETQPTYEVEVYHKNGSIRYLDVTEVPLRDADGTVIAVEGIAHNITDRKHAEEALRQSKQQLADILEFFPDPTIVIDAHGRITAWNRALEKLTQVKACDMLGKGNFEYALPFYGERRPILIDLALEADEKFEQERYANIHRHGDTLAGEAYTPRLPGGRAYLYATASVLRDANGKVIGAIESIRDITDRKQADDELKRERDFRKTLIESSPSYFVAINGDGTTIMMNESMLEALGYEHDEVVGKEYLTTFIPERDRHLVSRVFQRILASHDPVVALNRVLTKNGEELLVEWRGRSIFKESGELDYFFGTGIDITARKKAEEKLQHTMEELKRSNRELEEFAYVASHDLQEPLRKIMTFGDRLKTKFGDRMDEKGHDYIARMQSAAERMQNLINDLLSYSRVTSKAKPFEQVNLNTVISEVLEDLEVRIKPDTDRINVADMAIIEADSRQMHQLFHNILSNALKFRRPGEPSIVTIECVSDTTTCTVKVTDNGIGFDEKYAESIFSIFKRLHSRSEFEGTGVGLAICKKIAVRHGGTIVASSPPGQGAIFTITLPLRQEKKEQAS